MCSLAETARKGGREGRAGRDQGGGAARTEHTQGEQGVVDQIRLIN